MVNQKLLDYVAQQLKNGVSQGAISAALIGAGWSEADVKEALQKSSAPAASSQPAFTVTPASVSTSPVQSTGPMVDGITNVASAKPSVFGSAASGSVKPAMATASGGRGATIGLVVCSVLVVGLAVLSGYLYMQYSQVATDLEAARGAGTSSAATVQKMEKDLQAATAEINSLKSDNAGLHREVDSLNPVSTNGKVGVAEVEGNIWGRSVESNGVYTLVSAPSRVVFTVKNANDPKVVAFLKGVADKDQLIRFVHSAGSTSVKVIPNDESVP